MGAQKSIHAGKAKVDVHVDFTHKLYTAILLSNFRSFGDPFSQVVGSLCIKHPNLLGGNEKLDVCCDKGLHDSNFQIAYRKPRAEWLSQQSFVIQHTVSPEIGVHGFPIDNFSRSGSGGVNLNRFSAGIDINEPACFNWSSTTSIKFEHIRPINDDGHSILRDLNGFPVTCRELRFNVTIHGSSHDTMVVFKHDSRYARADEHSFSKLSLQVEQGIPILSKWLTFNKIKFVASKGVKLGPAFFLASLTGGSIVGDIAPYQAFAIGGLGSVRGYGEGAVGSGRSCLIMNNELTFPLNQMLEGMEGAVFLDSGTDLGSGHLVPGNPALRQGKPGTGIGLGYGIRMKTWFGQFQIDYVINAFQQKSVYVGISNSVS